MEATGPRLRGTSSISFAPLKEQSGTALSFLEEMKISTVFEKNGLKMLPPVKVMTFRMMQGGC